jgi:hypothetical protein
LCDSPAAGVSGCSEFFEPGGCVKIVRSTGLYQRLGWGAEKKSVWVIPAKHGKRNKLEPKLHLLCICKNNHSITIIEGSLEVKLPTIWTDEKQSWAEAERRE